MFKWVIISIFASLLEIIVTNPTMLTNLSITTPEQAAEALAFIQPGEALPLVMIDRIFYDDSSEAIHALRFPEDVTQVITVDGKMVTGTEFASFASNSQIFFCPKENSDEVCLAPKDFENWQRLQCTEEPEPVLKRGRNIRKCGYHNENDHHSVVYEPYKYETAEVTLYEFCYDNIKQKTLYTTHSIMSPKLLSSKLLYREQRVSYPFRPHGRFQTSNYESIRNAIRSESSQSTTPNNPMYAVQKLVPSEDMAFALWQKPLYKFFNAELQHKQLLPHWNMINGFIADEAIRVYNDNIDYFVSTGVFEVTATYPGDTQIYNMWLKVIQAKRKTQLLHYAAVAILMNNFIDSTTDNSILAKFRQTKIETYCTENLCVDTLITKFAEDEGRVRCCPLTAKIGALVDIQFIYNPLPVLEIPGVTFEFN